LDGTKQTEFENKGGEKYFLKVKIAKAKPDHRIVES